MSAAVFGLPRFLHVTTARRETGDTVTLLLDTEGGFDFRPGQFNMLYAFGVGEIPISISGDPARRGELVHTVRAVGAVSTALTRLKKGDRVGVRGPFGTGWPLDSCVDHEVLVIAGGLGLAPLRSAILHVLSGGRCRRLIILYGARTPDDLLFRHDLETWRSLVEVKVTVDRAGPGWSGPVGVVPALLSEVFIDSTVTVAWVCGPEVMMRFTVRELERRGITPERIFLSLERNMKCGVGLCGHCQLGPLFVCKDGPVVRLDRVHALLGIREL